MALLYKLTNKKHQTYNNTQWGENVTHTTDGSGELCGSGWLHAYTSPLLAVLLNPVHAKFDDPVLWVSEGIVEKTDNGLKVGTTKLTTIKPIPIPVITTEQRVKFAILCAKKVNFSEQWNRWADKWLSGKNRTYAAAYAAAYAADRVYSAAAYAAARAAARAADYAAANAAASAAASAAYAAANAAANAAYAAARAAASAAYAAAGAAAYAAEADAGAAAYAAEADASADNIDLIAIAKESCK